MTETTSEALLRENTYLKSRVAQLQSDVTDLSAELDRLRQERERLHGRMQARSADPLGGGQARLAAADRLTAALRVRIVRGEQVELGPALAHEGAHVLERIGREPQLGADLLGGPPRHLRQVRLRARPDRRGVVQPADH